MDTLIGGYKRSKWAAAIRSKTMANLDALAEQLNDNGKQAVVIAREDLLTHTDAEWWIVNADEFSAPDRIFNILSDSAKAAIDALRQ
jgi:hypothetical protein